MTKRYFGLLIFSLMIIQPSIAQVWGGGPNQSDYGWRFGNTSIGMNAGAWASLHVYNGNVNSQVAISGLGPGIKFNEGGSFLDQDRAAIGMASGDNHYVGGSILYDLCFKANTSTGNLLFSTGTANSERVRIASNGNMGIGSGFTSTSQPSQLLHLRKTSSPNIFIEGLSGPTSGGAINFGYNGSNYFTLNQSHMANGVTNGAFLRIGVYNTGNGITFQPTGTVAFASTSTFGFGAVGFSNYQGLSGKYIFDDQVSATKLLIGATSLAPYATIPANYLFSVKGNSNFEGLIQINNTTDLDPTNVISGTKGFTIGNSLVAAPTTYAVPYSWMQSEARPLALNPITNSDSATVNNSYVAIGFVPGKYPVPLGYKLAVKGKIICEELKVKFAGLWSDYVFEKEYQLRNLKEVEQYIVENKHLPDVPSEAEVKENGFETGQMDATLLRKIEELTLYMIEMNKQIDQLKKENIELKQTIKK